MIRTIYNANGAGGLGPRPAAVVCLLVFLGIINTTSPAIGGTAAGGTDDSQYLDRVESSVFETVGDHQSITKRAMICIAQIVKPGFVNAPTIVSSDIETGTIVANNSFRYSYGLLSPTARTTMTFQAKDGRFRIIHTGIEQFLDAQTGWTPIGTWTFSGGDSAREAIESISAALAKCVQTGPAANDNW